RSRSRRTKPPSSSRSSTPVIDAVVSPVARASSPAVIGPVSATMFRQFRSVTLIPIRSADICPSSCMIDPFRLMASRNSPSSRCRSAPPPAAASPPTPPPPAPPPPPPPPPPRPPPPPPPPSPPPPPPPPPYDPPPPPPHPPHPTHPPPPPPPSTHAHPPNHHQPTSPPLPPASPSATRPRHQIP